MKFVRFLSKRKCTMAVLSITMLLSIHSVEGASTVRNMGGGEDHGVRNRVKDAHHGYREESEENINEDAWSKSNGKIYMMQAAVNREIFYKVVQRSPTIIGKKDYYFSAEVRKIRIARHPEHPNTLVLEATRLGFASWESDTLEDKWDGKFPVWIDKRCGETARLEKKKGSRYWTPVNIDSYRYPNVKVLLPELNLKDFKIPAPAEKTGASVTDHPHLFQDPDMSPNTVIRGAKLENTGKKYYMQNNIQRRNNPNVTAGMRSSPKVRKEHGDSGEGNWENIRADLHFLTTCTAADLNSQGREEIIGEDSKCYPDIAAS